MDPRIEASKSSVASPAARDAVEAAGSLLAGDASLAEVLGLSHGDIHALKRRSVELLCSGHHPESLQLLDCLFCLTPVEPLYSLMRVVCLERTGKLEDAVTDLEGVIACLIEEDPDELLPGARQHLERLKGANG